MKRILMMLGLLAFLATGLPLKAQDSSVSGSVSVNSDGTTKETVTAKSGKKSNKKSKPKRKKKRKPRAKHARRSKKKKTPTTEATPEP